MITKPPIEGPAFSFYHQGMRPAWRQAPIGATYDDQPIGGFFKKVRKAIKKVGKSVKKVVKTSFKPVMKITRKIRDLPGKLGGRALQYAEENPMLTTFAGNMIAPGMGGLVSTALAPTYGGSGQAEPFGMQTPGFLPSNYDFPPEASAGTGEQPRTINWALIAAAGLGILLLVNRSRKD